MNMFSFVTFTLLWVVSCTIMYFALLRKLEAARIKLDEATKLCEQAARDREAAAEEREAARVVLHNMEKSMFCLN